MPNCIYYFTIFFLYELPENKDKIKDLFRLYNEFKTCEEFIMQSESDYHIKYTFVTLLAELENSYGIKFQLNKELTELLKKLEAQKDL